MLPPSSADHVLISVNPKAGRRSVTARVDRLAECLREAGFQVHAKTDLEEPHIWSTIAKRDSTIYWDNDFEVFMDPDGDGRCYFEFEINAQNTPWDLLMTKPYYQGGTFLNDFDFKGLQHATNIQGTINDPSDTDKCWTVELRIPLKSVNEKIVPGTTWKMNFSRVEWLQVDVKNGKYIKRPGTEGIW